jgi:hypothetical protein
MKNFYLLLISVVVTAAVYAQSARFYYPDAFYFVKEVTVTGAGEHPFHFEIAVKENPADTFSRPRIYAIQVRKGKEDIIGKTLVYAKASEGDWKTYSVDGIVDNEATRIWLYVAVNGNGDFYFDKLCYSLADATGTLQEKELPNASFEEKKLLSGYFISNQPSQELKVRLSSVAADGKQSVQVTVTGQKPGLSKTTIARN